MPGLSKGQEPSHIRGCLFRSPWGSRPSADTRAWGGDQPGLPWGDGPSLQSHGAVTHRPEPVRNRSCVRVTRTSRGTATSSYSWWCVEMAWGSAAAAGGLDTLDLWNTAGGIRQQQHLPCRVNFSREADTTYLGRRSGYFCLWLEINKPS